MDKFAAMQAFVCVVEAGSFTRAADRLRLPKPTVTRLIQSLETHLQTQLLNRTTRRVAVTADGAACYERAVRLLAEVDELETSMSHAKASPRGRLRIDVSASLGRVVLIPALPEFHALYPDIQIDLGVTDRPVDLIGENVDCVLRGGTISDPSLVARRIAELHFVAAASPAYLRRHGVPLHPRELEHGHRIVGYFSSATGRMIPLDFTKDGERLELLGRHVVAVNDSNAYLAAALAGLGIVQAPSFMLQDCMCRGELEPILVDWSVEPLPLHVVYPPNRHLSTKLRVFVDWVAELFARDPRIQRRSDLPAPGAAAAMPPQGGAEARAA